ncbi:MAG: hypothetical protein JSU94_01050 [Phycisphaerales bacterium]|nr:MAG: hypothetical protein JSU94_01050 [Phycisphaerales bacterium]
MQLHRKRALLAICILMLAMAAYLIVSRVFLKKAARFYERNPVRPVDFPAVLTPPDGAESIDYSSPSNDRGAPDTYALSFFVRDSYPGDETSNSIRRVLESAGYRRLEFLLMVPSTRPAWESRMMQRDHFYRWLEDWVGLSDETINVHLEYSRPPHSDHIDTNLLYVHLMYAGPKSWLREWLSNYKKMHPQEFEDE